MSESIANTPNGADKHIEDSNISRMVGSGITVKARSRLHMGFFDLNGSLGRRFGSIGVALDNPAFVINAYPAKTISVETSGQISSQAAEALIERSSILAKTLAKAWNIEQGMHIHLTQAIPQHAGLGSGTQLSLAIGSAMNSIYKLGHSIHDIAIKTQRGARSGIGLGTFATGGLILDGGRGENTLIPPVIARAEFPDDWCILLIFDHAYTGVHGTQEIEAFRNLPNMANEAAADLCRHVLMQALPALAERDLAAFGKAIRELQERTGDYFAPVQGGRYASPRVAKILEWLMANNVLCCGQSSWGPTSFAIFADNDQAQAMQQQLQTVFAGEENLQYSLCKAHNEGAILSTI